MAVTFPFNTIGVGYDWTSYIKYWDQSAGAYDAGMSAASPAATDIFRDDATVGDILYIGTRNIYWGPFYGILFDVTTAIIATGLTYVIEYNDNALGWTPITNFEDRTVGFTNLGANELIFDINRLGPMERIAVNGQTKWWLRFRITAVTVMTEGGRLDLSTSMWYQERIRIENYLVGAPADFDDIYNADLAGTWDLFIGAAAVNIVPTFEVRPAEMGSLKVDFSLAGCGSGAGDTIDVTGTDSEDNAISESIDVAAGDGAYTSALSYKTITDVDCTGFSGGTLTITQNRWGVVWKNRNNEFRLIRPPDFNNTYFTDVEKLVVLEMLEAMQMEGAGCMFMDNSTVILGEPVDYTEKIGRQGVTLWMEPRGVGYYQIGAYIQNDADLQAYNCSFINRYRSDTTMSMTGTLGVSDRRLYGCSFMNGWQMMLGQNNEMDIKSCFASAVSAVVRRPDATTTIDQVLGANCVEGVWFQTYGGVARGVIVGMRNGTVYCARMESTGTNDAYIIDMVLSRDEWDVQWASAGSGSLFIQFTWNLKFINKLGTALVGAVVVLKDQAGAEIFNLTTGAGGTIVEQDVTYAESTAAKTTEATFDYSHPFVLKVTAPGQKTAVMKGLDPGFRPVNLILTLDDRHQLTLCGHRVELLEGQRVRRLA